MLQSLSAMPLEMCMIAIVLAFIANFFFGKQKNRSIAKKWFSSIESVLESQFAVVGAYDPPQKSKLYKVSHSEYRVYASGRRNCSGLLAIIEMKKRQDVFSMIAAIFDVGVVNDRVIIQVPYEDENFDPVSFAICKKKDEKRMRRNNKDLDSLTTLLKSGIAAQNDVVVFADSPELEKELLKSDLVELILKNLQVIESVHVTDTYLSKPTLATKVIRIQAKIPVDFNMSDMESLIVLACSLVDNLAALKLTATSKKSALKKRELLKEQLNKISQEQRAERLREERLKREEEINSKLSKEELRKKEEKELKKLQKKRANARVKIIR